MNNNTISIPHIPFYFVRHGETDWNKFKQGLCSQDDIVLNQTGLQQAENARSTLFVRAQQTANCSNF